VVGSGNRDHYRNDSCGLVEMNVRAIRLGKGSHLRFGNDLTSTRLRTTRQDRKRRFDPNQIAEVTDSTDARRGTICHWGRGMAN
jgi:hypothetical protein